jgi:hypothetical protein
MSEDLVIRLKDFLAATGQGFESPELDVRVRLLREAIKEIENLRARIARLEGLA